MRYLKWLLIVVLTAAAAAEVIMNIETLGKEIILTIALPAYPIGYLQLPIWTALIIVFVVGFALAILLEVGAWYQYSRTIRLQRRQIRGLQDALDQAAAPGTAAPTVREADKPAP